ncbi:MAG: helix-turn-helix transcriptional regulator [Nostoc sp.]
MIVWKLNELMARKRVKNKDLASALGVDENSVYRLRRTDLMPRLTEERLNGICKALRCQPGDLLVFTPDDNDENQAPDEFQKVDSPVPQTSSSTTAKTNSQVMWLLPSEESA